MSFRLLLIEDSPTQLEAAIKSGNYENAKLFYSKSLEIADGKEIADIRFNLAEVLEAGGEFDASLRQYLLAADLYEQSPELFSRSLLRAAKLCEVKEALKAALKIYNRIVQKGAQEAKFAQERIDWIRVNVKF